jgi:hypothetical protein
MAKTLLSMQALQARALAEIRKQPGCHNVQDIAINRVTDEHAEITGPCVCCPQALLMPMPRLALRSMSKAFCVAITI